MAVTETAFEVAEAPGAPATATMRALGTTATVVTACQELLSDAVEIVRVELEAIDLACSRFRQDSEIQKLNEAGGDPVVVSDLLFEALRVALEVAQYTDGAVDPTVGKTMEALGYDRDFEQLARSPFNETRPESPPPPPQIGGSWWQIELDARSRTVRLPHATRLDLGASAKALVTDRCAARVSAETGGPVLVSVGGDVAVAGVAPDEGWPVGIAHDSSSPTDCVEQVVSIRSGGLASSSTAVRRWTHRGSEHHHIVDPATGRCAEELWTLVSVAGRSCVEANAASTAAIVWGETAVERLIALGQPARLAHTDGPVITLNGWPADKAPGS